MKLQIFPDAEGLALGAAEFIFETLSKAAAHAGSASIALSGGSTPARTYKELAELSHRRDLDWRHVKVYWGDERCVAADDPQSNFHMARATLLDLISIPRQNLYHMACEDDPETGAWRYEQILRSHFPDQAFPQFDLILLGLGDDGHTASLFPDTQILNERERWVAPVYVPRLDSWRISLTLPAINAASTVAFLVSGEAKASILKETLEASGPPTHPAQKVEAQGELHWLIDESAGRLLEKPHP